MRKVLYSERICVLVSFSTLSDFADRVSWRLVISVAWFKVCELLRKVICIASTQPSIYFFWLNTSKKIEKRYIKYVSIIYNRIVMRKSRRNNRLVKIIKNVLVGQVLYTIYSYVIISLVFFYADPFSIGILTSYRSCKTSRSEV